VKRFKTFALIGALIAGLFIGNTPPQMADAACGSIPYFFTNGTSIVDATTTNANNAFLIGSAHDSGRDDAEHRPVRRFQ
jgi:hypothetical protein